MDGLNIVGPTHDVVVIGGGKSELEALLAEEVARQGRRIEPEPKPENGSYYRSDHFSLAKKGVPMLYADSGIDIVGKGRAFGQARADDYTANRYHQPGDEYDPAWNWEGALQDLTLNYRIGRRIADGDAWPNWLPGDEFWAVRDASLAAGR
jgi:Zn-dependent M28 family amino/carboxypeptidase